METHYCRWMLALCATLLFTGCATSEPIGCGQGERPAVNDLLYFGTQKPIGIVAPEDWHVFVSESITPFFPVGLTWWEANGQWTDGSGRLMQETTYVVNILHPGDDVSERAIQAVVAEYRILFQQEAVLRVRSESCIAF